MILSDSVCFWHSRTQDRIEDGHSVTIANLLTCQRMPQWDRCGAITLAWTCHQIILILIFLLCFIFSIENGVDWPWPSRSFWTFAILSACPRNNSSQIWVRISMFSTECVSWNPSVPYWKCGWLTLTFKVILNLKRVNFANLSLSLPYLVKDSI